MKSKIKNNFSYGFYDVGGVSYSDLLSIYTTSLVENTRPNVDIYSDPFSDNPFNTMTSEFEIKDIVMVLDNPNLPVDLLDWRNKFVTITHKEIAKNAHGVKKYIYEVKDYENELKLFWEDELSEI